MQLYEMENTEFPICGKRRLFEEAVYTIDISCDEQTNSDEQDLLNFRKDFLLEAYGLLFNLNSNTVMEEYCRYELVIYENIPADIIWGDTPAKKTRTAVFPICGKRRLFEEAVFSIEKTCHQTEDEKELLSYRMRVLLEAYALLFNLDRNTVMEEYRRYVYWLYEGSRANNIMAATPAHCVWDVTIRYSGGKQYVVRMCEYDSSSGRLDHAICCYNFRPRADGNYAGDFEEEYFEVLSAKLSEF